VPGGVLHVFERHASLPGAGDEGDPQRVRPEFPGTVERSSPASRRTIFQASGSPMRLPALVMNSGPALRPLR